MSKYFRIENHNITNKQQNEKKKKMASDKCTAKAP